MTNHPPPRDQNASGEHIEHDYGSWISGPSITTEPVLAGDIKRGDVLLLDDYLLSSGAPAFEREAPLDHDSPSRAPNNAFAAGSSSVRQAQPSISSLNGPTER